MRRYLLFPLGALLLSGCLYSREISHIRNDVESALGASFDREVTFSVGPRTFRTIGWMARRTPQIHARLAGDYLAEIDRVKAGVFKVTDAPDGLSLDLDRMPRIKKGGWEVAARVTENEQTVWVLYRERYESVRDMLVLVLSPDELVIVRIHGHLDTLVERVSADREFLREMAEW